VSEGRQKAAVLFLSLYFPAKYFENKGYFLLLNGLTTLAPPKIRKAVTAEYRRRIYIVRLWFYTYKASSSLHWEADAGLAVLDRAFLTLAGI
jgi:hypothetical protein